MATAKREIRTYLLIVGRDADGEPYRQLAPYRVPIPGITDDFENMSNTMIKQARSWIGAERSLLERAAADLEAEALRRLEAIR